MSTGSSIAPRSLLKAAARAVGAALCWLRRGRSGGGRAALLLGVLLAGALAPTLAAAATKQQYIEFTSTAPVHKFPYDTYAVAAISRETGSNNPTGLNVTFVISDPSQCSVVNSSNLDSTGVVTFKQGGVCTIVAYQNGDANYLNAQSVSQAVQVDQKTQRIVFTSTKPVNPFVGDTYTVSAESRDAVTDAPTGLPVTLTSSDSSVCTVGSNPGRVEFKTAGRCTIVTYAASNALYAQGQSITQDIDVNQRTQRIVFTSTAPVNPFVGDPYTVSAESRDAVTNAPTGLPVTLTPSDSSVCTVGSNPGRVEFKTAGRCTIVASSAYNALYAPGQSITQDIGVIQKTQKIVFTSTAPVNPFVGDTYTVSAQSLEPNNISTGLTVDFYSIDTGICEIDSHGVVTFTRAGTCSIIARQSGSTLYAAASNEVQRIGVIQKTQKIVFTSTAPVNPIVGDTYMVSAESQDPNNNPTGLPVTFESSDRSYCTVDSAGRVDFKLAGSYTCYIYARQSGSPLYAAASEVSQRINVISPNIIVTITSRPTSTKVNDTYLVSASVARSGDSKPLTLPVTFSTAPRDVCTVDNNNPNVVRFNAAGTCNVYASVSNQSPYPDTISQAQQIIIGKAAQTVSFYSPLPDSPKVNGTFRVSARSSAQGLTPRISVTANPANACSINYSTDPTLVLFNAPGQCTVSASVTNDPIYSDDTASLPTFTIGKADQTTVAITNTPPANPQVGGSYKVTATSMPPGGTLVVTVTANPTNACSLDPNDSTKVLFNTAGSCSVKAVVTGNANYADFSPPSVDFTIGKGTQTVTITSSPPLTLQVGGFYKVTATSSAPGVTPLVSVVTTNNACSMDPTDATKVLFNAAGPCTVSAAVTGNANYADASATPQQITIGKAAQTVTITSSAPTAAKVNDTYKVTASSSAAGVTPVVAAGPGNVCTIDTATNIVTFKATGSCTVTAAVTGNPNYADASATPQVITVNLATTSVQLGASNAAPRLGETIVLTATVAPAAATGTVTFKEGSKDLGTGTLASGKATLSLATLTQGDHAITVVYSGDAIYATSTSAPVLVSVKSTSRPNPTLDKNVRAIIASQVTTAQRVAINTIDHVQRRLETLHDDETPGFVNGISVSGSQQMTGACASPEMRQTPTQGEDCRQRDKTLDKNLGKFSAISPDKDPPRNSFGTLDKDSRFKIWTAGSVIFGGVNVSTLGVVTKTHFTLAGITAGVDTKLMDGVKGGVAVTYSGQSDDIGDDGSRVNSRSVSGSVYGSWRMFDKVFLDGTLGYGDMSFSNKRFDTNAASFITGDRRGALFLASLALSYDQKMGALKFSPYARLDIINASLKSYSETGDANWTLSYDRSTMASQSLVLGLRGQYDYEQPWGILSPTWRFEYRRMLNGDVTQAMAYVTEPSTSYALTTTATDRDTLSAALGLKARSPGDVTGAVEYLLSGGTKSGLVGHGMRGSLRVGF